MKLPDLTRAQIVAVAGTAIGAAVAFGVPIDEKQSFALLALVGAVAGLLLHSDVKIRENRAKNADKLQPPATVTFPPGTTTIPGTIGVTGPVTITGSTGIPVTDHAKAAAAAAKKPAAKKPAARKRPAK